MSLMETWTEYRPETGLTEHNAFDDATGKLSVTKLQDVEPLVEATKAIANSGATNAGIKKGLWHYASIPLAVEYKLLMEYGLNINKKEHWPRLFDVLNREFPYLKTTHKQHRIKGGGRIYAANSAKRSASSTEATSMPGGRLLIGS